MENNKLVTVEDVKDDDEILLVNNINNVASNPKDILFENYLSNLINEKKIEPIEPVEEDKVRCVYCDFIGTVLELTKHKNDCKIEYERCSQCKNMILKTILEKHKCKTCSFRWIKCSVECCGLDVRYLDYSKHLSDGAGHVAHFQKIIKQQQKKIVAYESQIKVLLRTNETLYNIVIQDRKNVDKITEYDNDKREYYIKRLLNYPRE